MVKVKLNGSAVKLVLAQRNISQNALAKGMGVSDSYFSQMVRGVRNPSPKMRQMILDGLAPMEFDDLFIVQDGQNGDKAKTA